MKLLAYDGSAIPLFLRLTAEERRAGWTGVTPTYLPKSDYEKTETERLYYQSIADDKIRQRLKDEQRWKALRERKEADKAAAAAIWSKGKSKCRT